MCLCMPHQRTAGGDPWAAWLSEGDGAAHWGSGQHVNHGDVRPIHLQISGSGSNEQVAASGW